MCVLVLEQSEVHLKETKFKCPFCRKAFKDELRSNKQDVVHSVNCKEKKLDLYAPPARENITLHESLKYLIFHAIHNHEEVFNVKVLMLDSDKGDTHAGEKDLDTEGEGTIRKKRENKSEVALKGHCASFTSMFFRFVPYVGS